MAPIASRSTAYTLLPIGPDERLVDPQYTFDSCGINSRGPIERRRCLDEF